MPDVVSMLLFLEALQLDIYIFVGRELLLVVRGFSERELLKVVEGVPDADSQLRSLIFVLKNNILLGYGEYFVLHL